MQFDLLNGVVDGAGWDCAAACCQCGHGRLGETKKLIQYAIVLFRGHSTLAVAKDKRHTTHILAGIMWSSL